MSSWLEWTKGTYERLDGTLSEYVFASLGRMGCDMDAMDPTTGRLSLVKSPTPAFLAMLAYLTVVVVGLLRSEGKVEKKERKDPSWMKGIVLLHNLFLVVLSGYMSVGISWEAYKNGYKVWGNPYDPKETRMAYLIWVFYVSKLYEFFDTVIMLLKGNTKQVSFLHVYHHATISIIWWIIAFRAPGGDAYFSAAMNSAVHVLMYLYYFLAASLGKNDKVRSKYLWWGKHLTQIQMLQFFLNLCQAYYILYVESLYVTFLAQVLFYYMITLLILFGNFYVQKHMFKKKKTKVADKGKKHRPASRRPKRA